MRSHEIDNTDDIIDSRDIDARIEELEDMMNDCEGEDAIDEWESTSESDELNYLRSLRDDLEGYCPDWKYGVTLIRDSYFQEYAEELIKDIGDLPAELPGYIEAHIDWKGVADDIQQDYTSGEFDGVTYWAR